MKTPLDAIAFLERDDSGRTPAYFCRREQALLSQEVLAALIATGENEGKMVRVSLHPDADADMHDMVIYAPKTEQLPLVQKHLDKSETYHIIAGRLLLLIFDEVGQIRERIVLEPSGNLMYRVAENIYHIALPLEQHMVFHESRKGPFTGETNSVDAPWSTQVRPRIEAMINYYVGGKNAG